MRRARLERRRIGRTRLYVDHAALVKDRLSGISLTALAKKYGLSPARVVRFVREAQAGHGRGRYSSTLSEKWPHPGNLLRIPTTVD
jgi:hypothetical protein